MTGMPLGVGLRARRRRVVAVGEAAGPAQRGLGPAADPDRQRRALGRQRPEHEVVELVEPALRTARSSRTRGAATARSSRSGRRPASGTARSRRGSPNSRSFQPTPTPAIDPAAGQRVERRELLGEDDRVPLGHDDHARPEPERRVAGGDPGEGLDRVVVDPVVGGRLDVVDEDVVGRPDRVPAEPLGDGRGGLDGLGRGKVGEVGQGRFRSASADRSRTWPASHPGTIWPGGDRPNCASEPSSAVCGPNAMDRRNAAASGAQSGPALVGP